MIQKNIIFISLLVMTQAMFGNVNFFKQEFAKLRNNPTDFYVYKGGRDYCETVQKNGFNWADLKTFAKTPAGKTIIAYRVTRDIVIGYFMYKAYYYVNPSDKKPNDVAQSGELLPVKQTEKQGE